MFNLFKSLFSKSRQFKVNGIKVTSLKKGYLIQSPSKNRADAINRYIINEGIFHPNENESLTNSEF